MKKLFAACCAVLFLIIVVAPGAQADTNVNVRIEGKEETLFEKTIPVAIHQIEASSDTEPRECDGISEVGEEPAATPTLASAEAMESIGETFDATWFGGIGPFGDYFITRWGPDEQDNATGAWWGVLVNNVLTSVGGCQYRLSEGDEALWVYDAFSGRPMLALFPEAAHYTEGPRPTRVIARLDEPLPLEVVAYPAGGEGASPEVPSRAGSAAFEGAEVAPVVVDQQGFQRVDTASPDTVVSDQYGKASVTFTTPGIHRIKATGPLGEEDSVVRSNGLEVCVPAQPGDCGEPLATTPPPAGTTTPAPASPAPTTGSLPAPAAAPAAARISKPKLVRGKLADGKLTVAWQVLDPGAGIEGWRIATKTLGQKGGWVDRARGTTGTGATLRLPRGHRYEVRLTLTDAAGHVTTYALGKVAVPHAGRG